MNNLPNGAIVKLKGVENNFLIIARLPLVEQNGETVYFDYQAAVLPQGISTEKGIFFNSDDINYVIFHGLAGNDTVEYNQGVQDWLKNNTEFKRGIIDEDTNSDDLDDNKAETNNEVETGPFGF
ncbi:hypothetical protein WOSG25_050750 [Weissella oryzae SG25]|uniref:DUF4176 domain-containing protein n=1 Tax=Weissella oryzae (strain DSM 25784 / JCM 18191 / LMG 30913 / SG25) TaxID=1329250 RepID=A0A069CUD0_WEIOS|nr:DUF4176 domain-containing protein [Weissella oryzae]GAK30803.1 hypothetical protein WOSG25_050750 [Weissella oryzae SG25]